MKIVIVGDILLDRDISGRSSRLSPDGPVPVLDVDHTLYRPGGAGLAAAVLARGTPRTKGTPLTLVTVLSTDSFAHKFSETLTSVAGDGVNVVSGPSGVPTPIKTRLQSGSHPIARIDEWCGPPTIPEVTLEMTEAIATADAILVSDYGRGLTSNETLREALAQRARTVPLVWDPHPSGAPPVPGCSLVTPNLSEAAGLTGAPPLFDTAFSAGETLRTRWECAAVAVTAGKLGAVLTTGGHVPLHLPARPAVEADPCGAGDRFATSVTQALGEGHDLGSAMFQAVTDTGEFLKAGGVAGLEAQLTAMHTPQRDAVRLANHVRATGGTVVATGGCFDLLHAGHARVLAGARRLGDCLIVCINSDESVRRIKGHGRPIMTQTDRAELLESLECVDAVMVFEEDTPTQVLGELMPDVWVKGGDYAKDTLPESRALAEWGGRIVALPYHPGRSTTRIASAIERVS